MSISFAHVAATLTLAGLVGGTAVSMQHTAAASQHAVILAELAHYRSAVVQFKQQYDAAPGDYARASSHWDSKDGDGDGKIGISAQAATHPEVMLFWQHLALANLIEGTYSGASGLGESGYHAIISENVPASAYEGGGWSLHPDIGEAKDNNSRFDGYYGSYLFFGRQTDRAVTYGEILSANVMAAMDAKVDDGKPATGSFVAARPSLSPNCVTGNDANAIYQQNEAPNACHIVIKDVAEF